MASARFFSRKPKNRGPLPLGASYGRGDFRQAAVGPPLPSEAALEHHDLVMLALPLAGRRATGRACAARKPASGVRPPAWMASSRSALESEPSRHPVAHHLGLQAR